MSLTIRDVQVGDIVRLDCPKLLQNTRHQSTTIEGVVEHVFDALTSTGKEGNLEIDIRYNHKWLRWKPLSDGGTLTVIQRKR